MVQVYMHHLQEHVKEMLKWDEMADDWDNLGARNAVWFDGILRERVQLNPDMIVLDFGCATGLITDILRHRVKKVVAVDVSYRMLAKLKEKAKSEGWDNVEEYYSLFGYHEMPATQEILRKYEGKIDLIVASATLGFVTRALAENTMQVIGHLLKPGGVLFHTDRAAMGACASENTFDSIKAEAYYENAGLVTVSTSIIPDCDLGQNGPCDVFLGIARKIPDFVIRQMKMIQAFDHLADIWDEQIGDGLAKWTYETVREHIPITPDMIVLDFGCGMGETANYVRHDVRKVVAVDIAPRMVALCQEKIDSQGWKNVQVHCALLGDPTDDEAQAVLRKYKGKIDLIIADSVFSNLIKETVDVTMEALSSLLKPGGHLCHLDLPKREVGSRDGFTKGKARHFYDKGGLEKVSMNILTYDESRNVFVGIARKPSCAQVIQQVEKVQAWGELGDGQAKWAYDIVKETIQITPDMTVLDFGCGAGQMANIVRHDVRKVVAVDGAPRIVELCEDNIKSQGWKNVQVHCALLGNASDEVARAIVRKYKGKIDLVIASSVLGSVIPKKMGATMTALSSLLKPGGYLCHMDLPKREGGHPDGFSTTKARQFYEKGRLQAVSMSIRTFNESHDVFVGIARKP